ncbi:LytTR family DNA-binding domain-containing protein [Massilia sp. CF038]|uniref:LytR/AlgR family response regulator transcription factor n=1 Tax=Massilia sp. CF038 TaxID=1881045 RepID=UPI00091B8CF2|nr:LytTR family transcriptional regulator DNA-binding domain-containing protein [Massilia sp. CF038]SHH02209.1 two component transcriptional regulator, LytTR family [Massilia sp. CF038]
MRVIIVDDEDLARGLVREFLAAHADIDIVAECANGFDAVKAITELVPDLVFLDIQMPKLDGFEVVELAGRKTHYIFVTAYDQYALKAFEVHAVDYLLKPYSQQRFDEALAHARASLRAGQGVDAVVADAALRNKPLGRILIRDGARVHVIGVDKIDFIEAQDDYVQINSEGKGYLKNQRLADLESQLDPDVFVRVHRSYIVNIGSVSRIEQGKDTHTAILHDGARVPISRSGYQKVKNLVG